MESMLCKDSTMRLKKYNTKKCMIDNMDGTYSFLNVTFWEVIKLYMSNKLSDNIMKESKDAKEKSDRSEDLDR